MSRYNPATMGEAFSYELEDLAAQMRVASICGDKEVLKYVALLEAKIKYLKKKINDTSKGQ